MFTSRELATLLAALRFWQEEIAPYGPQTWRPYLESVERPHIQPLSPAEINGLIDRLKRLPTE